MFTATFLGTTYLSRPFVVALISRWLLIPRFGFLSPTSGVDLPTQWGSQDVGFVICEASIHMGEQNYVKL